MNIEKPDIKRIRNVYEVLTYLDRQNTKYITTEGRAFVDGIYCAGKFPELVLKEDYDKLLKEYVKLTKKRKWF